MRREAADRGSCITRTPNGFTFDECHIDKSGAWLVAAAGRPDGGARQSHRRYADTGRTDAHRRRSMARLVTSTRVTATRWAPTPTIAPAERDDSPEVSRREHAAADWSGRALQQAVGHRGGQSHRARQRGPRRLRRIAVRLRQQRELDARHGRTRSSASRSMPNRNTDGLARRPRGGAGDDRSAARRAAAPTTTRSGRRGTSTSPGRYFIWTTNLGGNRLDAFIVKIPAERLTPP